ncbi:MAG: phosphohydrolase [Hyphococcus sp.]|nr:MAG: phosphohydrolase [Marinicaulis sp.]
MPKTQRIRDPIHDLIVFDENDEIDQLAWALLETPEFQRLRRVKQLGVSEFVFPGATHTRFSHSVGVFHVARQLLRLIQREIDFGRVEGNYDQEKGKIALLAALLHDIGHGPFSHAFEEARKSIFKRRGIAKIKKHEIWTAEIIENPEGCIFPILENWSEGSAKRIADLLRAEIPSDMYHSIVSSSFDADRLDYLQRDRVMTGAGSGVFDFSWLLDNVRVASIDVSPPSEDGGDSVYSHSFCLGYKARDAAEDFLLSRYRLYTNVYFHKTTRGIEQLLTALYSRIAELAEAKAFDQLGLSEDEPLVRFLCPDGESLSIYLKLDDTVIWGVIERLERAPDARLATLASRIRSRKKMLAIDIQNQFPDDSELQRRAQHMLDEKFREQLGLSVFRDEALLTLYGEIGADDTKAQKRLMIQLPDKHPREITNFKDATIVGSEQKRRFLRYYFLEESDHRKACETLEGIRR